MTAMSSDSECPIYPPIPPTCLYVYQKDKGLEVEMSRLIARRSPTSPPGAGTQADSHHWEVVKPATSLTKNTSVVPCASKQSLHSWTCSQGLALPCPRLALFQILSPLSNTTSHISVVLHLIHFLKPANHPFMYFLLIPFLFLFLG